MRWDVGGHTNGNTDRTVYQQVWEPGRQDGRLLGSTVVVVLEINGVLVDIANHFHSKRCHLALGVTRRSSWVVSRGSEVTLTRNQRVTQVPILNQTHQSVVNCAVTVRVELAHHITDNAGTLGELLVWAVATVIHRVKHAAVHRL